VADGRAMDRLGGPAWDGALASESRFARVVGGAAAASDAMTTIGGTTRIGGLEENARSSAWAEVSRVPGVGSEPIEGSGSPDVTPSHSNDMAQSPSSGADASIGDASSVCIKCSSNVISPSQVWRSARSCSGADDDVDASLSSTFMARPAPCLRVHRAALPHSSQRRTWGPETPWDRDPNRAGPASRRDLPASPRAASRPCARWFPPS